MAQVEETTQNPYAKLYIENNTTEMVSNQSQNILQQPQGQPQQINNNQNQQGQPQSTPRLLDKQIIYPTNANGYRNSITVNCPYCKRVGQTRITYQPGSWTLIMALLLFLCCFIMAIIPFFLQPCQTVKQHCQYCFHEVGSAPFQPI